MAFLISWKLKRQIKTKQSKLKLTVTWVYVGTYAKYASGSIAGVWVCLEEHDKETIAAYCRMIHRDEADPELMVQDFEGLPTEYYCESGLSEGIWEWLQLDEHDRELLARYVDAVGLEDATIETARDAFSGTAESEAAFAENFAEEIGGLPEDMPAWIVVDWEATWNCNLRHDFSTSQRENGTVWFFHQ